MSMAIFTIHDSCLISDITWKYVLKLDGTVNYNNGKQFNTINIQYFISLFNVHLLFFSYDILAVVKT